MATAPRTSAWAPAASDTAELTSRRGSLTTSSPPAVLVRSSEAVRITPRIRHTDEAVKWQVKRTTKGVTFPLLGYRIALREGAALALAKALVNALEQDPPPAPALQLVA